jgi:hypothetical protein
MTFYKNVSICSHFNKKANLAIWLIKMAGKRILEKKEKPLNNISENRGFGFSSFPVSALLTNVLLLRRYTGNGFSD